MPDLGHLNESETLFVPPILARPLFLHAQHLTLRAWFADH